MRTSKMPSSWRKPLCLFSRGAAATSAFMLTIVAVGLIAAPAVAAPLSPGAPAAGPITMNPASGNSQTNFGLSFSSPEVCPGNASTDGYRWHSFITPAEADVAAFTWTPQGAPVGGPGFTQNLFSDGGSAIRARFPGDAPAGAISDIPVNFELSGGGVFGPDPLIPLPAGSYKIGIACARPTANVWRTEKFWTAPITITADAANGGSGQFTYAPTATSGTTTTTASTTTTTLAGTTTTMAGATTTVASGTTTTVAGATTTVAGATTTVAGATTTVAGAVSGTVIPASPAPGGSYTVTFPRCQVGETITFSQPQSTPATTTAVCAAAAALESGAPAGFRRPAQAATGTATGTFTAAPRTAGTYTVTMTGTASPQRTATFVISATGTGTGTGSGTAGGTGTSTGATGGSGVIPSTGSSTTAMIVWGVLLLVFGRMAILLGRKPKVLSGH